MFPCFLYCHLNPGAEIHSYEYTDEALQLIRILDLSKNRSRARKHELNFSEETNHPECFSSKNTVTSFQDGCFVIQLLETHELLHEAFLMRNCLNDTEKFAASDIYSLRDASGQPRANIEVREGLLIQICGYANNPVDPHFHPHLRSFLSDLGIPTSDVGTRLGLIEFDGNSYYKLDDCVGAFSDWAAENSTPMDLPFMRHPIIREFLNIFAQHGRSAKETTREVVLSLFRPSDCSWRPHNEISENLNRNVEIIEPLLPSALYHLARYGAVPREAYDIVFRDAISDIAVAAGQKPTNFYDLAARNKILTAEAFSDLLIRAGVNEMYEQARQFARTDKLSTLRKALSQNIVSEERFLFLADRLIDDILLV